MKPCLFIRAIGFTRISTSLYAGQPGKPGIGINEAGHAIQEGLTEFFRASAWAVKQTGKKRPVSKSKSEILLERIKELAKKVQEESDTRFKAAIRRQEKALQSNPPKEVKERILVQARNEELFSTKLQRLKSDEKIKGYIRMAEQLIDPSSPERLGESLAIWAEQLPENEFQNIEDALNMLLRDGPVSIKKGVLVQDLKLALELHMRVMGGNQLEKIDTDNNGNLFSQRQQRIRDAFHDHLIVKYTPEMTIRTASTADLNAAIAELKALKKDNIYQLVPYKIDHKDYKSNRPGNFRTLEGNIQEQIRIIQEESKETLQKILEELPLGRTNKKSESSRNYKSPFEKLRRSQMKRLRN